MSSRILVFASGSGSNFQALADAGVPVAALFASAPHIGAVAKAESRGIPVVIAPTDPAGLESRIAQAQPDWILLAGWLRLIPANVVARWAGRILNIHPSLLPRHGGPGLYGRRVHEAVLAAGDTESGCTVHRVTEAYDEGPILAQARVPVLPGDTPESLAARVLAAEHRLYPETVFRTCLAPPTSPR